MKTMVVQVAMWLWLAIRVIEKN